MFFKKPFHSITYKDVVEFCKRGFPEGKHLDYKFLLPRNHEKFAKTIASFANSMGGLIVIGVEDDKNDKPCPPFVGIPFHAKMRGTIEDIIQKNIEPVVFVDVNVCINDAQDKMFVLVNIPQSNLTPHLVGKHKRAYIRTGQSSRPETFVHPDKLPWLLDHRQKSERLRHILYDKAESHFEIYLKTLQTKNNTLPSYTLSMQTLYPTEPFIHYTQLPTIIEKMMIENELLTNASVNLVSVQDGAVIISNDKDNLSSTEFNTYGLLMHKQVLPIGISQNKKIIHLETIAKNINLFLQVARFYYDQISCTNPMIFRLKIENIGAYKTQLGKTNTQILESYLRLERNLSLTDLESNFSSVLLDILSEAIWSLGLRPTTREIEELKNNLFKRSHQIR